MDPLEASRLLGVDPTAGRSEVRRAWRRQMRTTHPDVAGPAGAARAVLLNDALRALLADPDPAAPDASSTAPAAGERTSEPVPPGGDRPGVAPASAEQLDADGSLFVAGVGPEAFAILTEAAAHVGDVAYIDRQLGLVEIIVRFEGGPSCSVVMTMQGRLDHTEVFVTMESIEATPTPPIDAVVDALQAAIDLLV